RVLQKKYETAEIALRRAMTNFVSSQEGTTSRYFCESLLGETLIGQKKYAERNLFCWLVIMDWSNGNRRWTPRAAGESGKRLNLSSDSMKVGTSRSRPRSGGTKSKPRLNQPVVSADFIQRTFRGETCAVDAPRGPSRRSLSRGANTSSSINDDTETCA